MPNDPSTGTPSQRLEELFDAMIGFQAGVQHVLSDISELLQKSDLRLTEAADIGFMTREISRAFDDLRKEAEARSALAGKRIAVALTERSLNDPNTPMTIQGRLASATPDVKIEAVLPRAGTKEFDTFLEHLGVPPALVESGLIKPDWKRVQEHLNRLQEDGKPLPPGVGKTYPRFHSVFRRKRS